MIAREALVAALEAKAGACPRCQIVTTTWRSLSLDGERHILSIALGDARAMATLLDGLEDYEFDLPKGFVADVFVHDPVIIDGATHVRIEVLTLAAD